MHCAFTHFKKGSTTLNQSSSSCCHHVFFNLSWCSCSGAGFYRLLASSQILFLSPSGMSLVFNSWGQCRQAGKKKASTQASKQATALLSAARGWVRCYWELTEQGVECEAGIWISVCFTTLCCLIRKSGLVASLGKPHSPARKLPCSGSLHEYWLMMPFWGYRYLAKWKRLSCIAQKSQRNILSQPFPSTAVLQSQAGAEIFEKPWTNGDYLIQGCMLFTSSSPGGTGKWVGQPKAMPDHFSTKPASSGRAGPCPIGIALSAFRFGGPYRWLSGSIRATALAGCVFPISTWPN